MNTNVAEKVESANLEKEEARGEVNILAELEQLDVLEAKEFQEGVAFHAFRFSVPF